MARYIGTIQGNRGETSRQGTKISGLRTSCTAWDASVEVLLKSIDGRDVFDVKVYGGTFSVAPERTIARVTASQDGRRVIVELFGPQGEELAKWDLKSEMDRDIKGRTDDD